MATIAWIEDDALDIGDVLRPLKRGGHKFAVYTNVREAMDGVASLKNAHLILLDVLLPSGDPATANDDPNRLTQKDSSSSHSGLWRYRCCQSMKSLNCVGGSSWQSSPRLAAA